MIFVALQRGWGNFPLFRLENETKSIFMLPLLLPFLSACRIRKSCLRIARNWASRYSSSFNGNAPRKRENSFTTHWLTKLRGILWEMKKHLSVEIDQKTIIKGSERMKRSFSGCLCNLLCLSLKFLWDSCDEKWNNKSAEEKIRK